MAVTLGRIEEFDGNKEEWHQYQEQLEHLFRANEIEDETKKWTVFLTLIGANAYKLLQNLIAPAKPDTKTYAELVQALANHYSPTPAESVQRFKFHSRIRRPEESVATLVAELRSLAEFATSREHLKTCSVTALSVVSMMQASSDDCWLNPSCLSRRPSRSRKVWSQLHRMSSSCKPLVPEKKCKGPHGPPMCRESTRCHIQIKGQTKVLIVIAVAERVTVLPGARSRM